MKLLFLLALLFCCSAVFAQRPFENVARVGSPDTTRPDSVRPDTTPIEILNINQMHGLQGPGGQITELLGNVEMRQGEAYFWCDTGYLLPLKQMQAVGNVQIAPDDTVRIFSDSLFYDGIWRKAILKKEVVLEDNTAKIFTKLLHYDLNTRIAEYPQGVLIISDSTQLISKGGFYDAKTNQAFFRDSVRVANPNFKLVADSLLFNTRTEVVTYLSPTVIYDKERVIYCERGYYDSKREYGVFAQKAYYLNRGDNKTEKATGDSIIYDGKKKQYYLVGNATYSDDEQEVTADSIYFDDATQQYYFRGNPQFRSKDSTQTQRISAGNSNFDKATGDMVFTEGVRVSDKGQLLTAENLRYNKDRKDGTARGNAVFTDSTQNSQLSGGVIHYNDSTKSVFAYEKPIFQTIVDNDSIWLTADTLRSVQVDDSTAQAHRAKRDSSSIDSLATANSDTTQARHLYAYRDARIYKNNLQALADSLFYDGLDSLFTLFGQPVLWADSVQFTADTLQMRMRDKQLKQIDLLQNALIIDEKDGTYYDQIKGRYLTAYLDSSKIQTVDVQSSGEAIYYAQDGEKRYIGVNRVECSNMRLNFAENQVQKIRFYVKPQAAMMSMGKTDHSAMRLKGFLWREVQRPRTREDIFLRLPLPALPNTSAKDEKMEKEEKGEEK